MYGSCYTAVLFPSTFSSLYEDIVHPYTRNGYYDVCMSVLTSVFCQLCVGTTPPVSPASSEPGFGAATSPSPMDTDPVNTRGRYQFKVHVYNWLHSV